MPSRLIFGSCSSQHYKDQPLWPVIQKRNATAFIWGGDAVYADDRSVQKNFFRKERISATPEYLRHLYQEQRNKPAYKALLDTNISIFGTIDDHDYGKDNGDITFPFRTESAIEFVKFLDLPKDSAMFQRASQGKGVYGVQVYDFSRDHGNQLLSDQEAGLDPDVVPDRKVRTGFENDPQDEHNNRRVAVFVLDVRSNKSPWIDSLSSLFNYVDTVGDFLGEEQWNWFHNAIGRSDAAVNIVVSGIQFHAERFYDYNAAEGWSGFPSAQNRLYQTILQPNVQAPILISGDVHMAQIMRKDCSRPPGWQHDNHNIQKIRPLYEITTSGMTHSWGTKVCGRANDNPFCHMWYVNVAFRPLFHLSHWMSSWTDLLLDEETNQLQYSLNLNAAELEFDWDTGTVLVRVWGEGEELLLHQEWPLQTLSTIHPENSRLDSTVFDAVRYKLEQSTILSAQSDDWVCVQYRGTPNTIQSALGLAIPMSLLFLWLSFPIFLFIFGIKYTLKNRRQLLIDYTGEDKEKAH